jgi:hypothetical protein
MPISRRSFLTIATVLAAPLTGDFLIGESEANEPYSDPTAADDWITQMMQKPTAANQPLFLGRFADRFYFLREPIGWTPNEGQEGHKPVEVPTGFVTDFASIPRAFWALLPPDGLYTYPAIIHDYLYWEQPVSKSEADLILRYAMEDFKVDKITIETIYNGVKFGGAGAWNSNAALKASGEKRTLKTFPEDPKITWEDWKTKPNAF